MKTKNIIQIRKVIETDWDFILKIRNQSSSRIAFHDTYLTPFDIHKEYMIKLRDDPNSYQWIIIYNKKSVGYIKIINSELGSFLLDGYKGKGIGTKAYELVFLEAKVLGLKKLFATVKVNRPTSLRFEEKLGWIKKKTIYKNNEPYSYHIEKILD